jgi:hypothetical protein
MEHQHFKYEEEADIKSATEYCTFLVLIYVLFLKWIIMVATNKENVQNKNMYSHIIVCTGYFMIMCMSNLW